MVRKVRQRIAGIVASIAMIATAMVMVYAPSLADAASSSSRWSISWTRCGSGVQGSTGWYTSAYNAANGWRADVNAEVRHHPTTNAYLAMYSNNGGRMVYITMGCSGTHTVGTPKIYESAVGGNNAQTGQSGADYYLIGFRTDTQQWSVAEYHQNFADAEYRYAQRIWYKANSGLFSANNMGDAAHGWEVYN